MSRQINTRVTSRSWYNNRFGAMMISSSMDMKEGYFTAVDHS
jgi:hypothetical protein